MKTKLQRLCEARNLAKAEHGEDHPHTKMLQASVDEERARLEKEKEDHS